MGRLYATGSMGTPLCMGLLTTSDGTERLMYGDTSGAVVLVMADPTGEVPGRNMLIDWVRRVGGRRADAMVGWMQRDGSEQCATGERAKGTAPGGCAAVVAGQGQLHRGYPVAASPWLPCGSFTMASPRTQDYVYLHNRHKGWVTQVARVNDVGLVTCGCTRRGG
jgi:hypothetical protein